ncbi:NlpC/P60 family protein [Klebsiella michiganensis]|uniref:NlpC/P60 family protein n=1 Tax=Klebsiella michiganensis TaxID=1134687 RepID=UPI0013D2C209|nr:NlpC/P60 family protein [Klebsiella michiganensis]
MTQSEFIGLVNGKPWANRACTFDELDCWGLVVLYYRHVLGLELHHVAGYESGSDFITCYEEELEHWHRVPVPVSGCLAVFYYGNQPAHVGVMINPGKCLHSRGEFGFVRTDSAVILQKIYNKVEYLVHGSI